MYCSRTIHLNGCFVSKIVAESYLFTEMPVNLCGISECSSEVHVYVVPHLFLGHGTKLNEGLLVHSVRMGLNVLGWTETHDRNVDGLLTSNLMRS